MPGILDFRPVGRVVYGRRLSLCHGGGPTPPTMSMSWARAKAAEFISVSRSNARRHSSLGSCGPRQRSTAARRSITRRCTSGWRNRRQKNVRAGARHVGRNLSRSLRKSWPRSSWDPPREAPGVLEEANERLSTVKVELFLRYSPRGEVCDLISRERSGAFQPVDGSFRPIRMCRFPGCDVPGGTSEQAVSQYGGACGPWFGFVA